MKEYYEKLMAMRVPLKVSVAQGIVMGLFKILMGIISVSWLLVFSAFYNFGMATARGAILKEKRSIVGWIVIVSSVLFVINSYGIYQNGAKAEYTRNVAILIAAITFTDIVMAIVRIVRAGKNNEPERRIIGWVSLATALISLTLTQTAILSFTQPGRDMSQYNGMCGMIFGCAAVIIGVIILRTKEPGEEQV